MISNIITSGKWNVFHCLCNTGQKKCGRRVLSHCPVHQHNTRAEGGDTATEAQAS